ncbi:MAG TPA: hypothetical protein VF269_03295 [Rhodanobacteraceae bacterium]
MLDDLLVLRGAHARRVDMKFFHKTTHQVCYVDQLPASSHVVVAEWHDAGGTIHVIERDEPIRDVVAYDEPLLVEMFQLHDRHVTVPASTPGFTRAEALIAGFKHLLHNVIFPGIDRKYVFVRTRFDQCPHGAFDITFSRKIGDFFQANITMDGRGAGQIFFGEWQ